MGRFKFDAEILAKAIYDDEMINVLKHPIYARLFLAQVIAFMIEKAKKKGSSFKN
jgi:hypothetical protein